MQANWSIILNIVLLAGVVVAIFRVLRSRKKSEPRWSGAPSLGPQAVGDTVQHDDIISVRKLNIEPEAAVEEVFVDMETEALEDTPSVSAAQATDKTDNAPAFKTPPLMMFLLAKANRQLVGYELLQAVLAAGLRFGEGNLFHRHQHANGQGTILCSLAAATDEGVFDLQNIGAFTVRGLCLYMHPSGNPGIDAERFDIMLDTAKALSDDLDTYLLDEYRKPLSDASIQRYHQRLNLIEEAVV